MILRIKKLGCDKGTEGPICHNDKCYDSSMCLANDSIVDSLAFWVLIDKPCERMIAVGSCNCERQPDDPTFVANEAHCD